MSFYFKNITNQGLAQQALDETLNMGSTLRRSDMQKRLDYFNDIQDAYLEEALNEQFEYPDRLKLQREFFNVTNLMINELAVLYNEEPLRELKDATDKDKELFEAILSESNLNNVLQTTNQYVKLTKNVLVKPEWDEDGKITTYRIFTPNMYDVIMDEKNPTKAKAIVYSRSYKSDKYYNNDNTETSPDSFAEDNTIFHLWTDEKYFMFTFKLNEKGVPVAELMDNEGNPNNINPYKTLDIFVVFRDGVPIDNFFLEGGGDIIVTNESINILLTELNHLIKMQSFSIPVRKGAPKDSTGLILDPSMTVDLPADTDMGKSDFKFATPAAKISEVQSEIEQKLRRLAIKYKMNPDMFVASGNRSSSDSLQLQNYAQGRLIKKDKPYFRKNEARLFEMTKLVHNTHAPVKFSDKASLMVDFRDSEMPMTTEERDQHNILLYNNGIMSKAEWLMDENPDIATVKDAEAKLKEIDAVKEDTDMDNVMPDIEDNNDQENVE